jgi:predicted RNA polymerase sigma factor
VPASDSPAAKSGDTLILLFRCCHPALSVASQITLTLRAIGGLATGPEQAERLAAVLHVLYLIFTEGYVSTSGPRLPRS